jgi:dolichyl-phosphate-mannose-protein mannosyltransferase
MREATKVMEQTSDTGVIAPEVVATPAARLGDRLRAIAWTPWLLVLLIGVSLVLRLLWLDKPTGALIFDESYYVNAARVILDLPVPAGAPYASAPRGLDPNTEHPPLAKLLMAASMRLFGDNAWGWRLASVLFGTLSIPLVYGIARLLGGTGPVALLAAFIYAFDNLVFVHSRIGTLDIFVVAFLLLGLYLYLRGWAIPSGLALVAATLCKIGGIYGLGVLWIFVGLNLLRTRATEGRWCFGSLRPLLVTTITYAVGLIWLLGALDSIWSPYDNPIAHLQHIFQYGFALTRQEGPQGQESNPWQWLLNEVQITYLRTDVQTAANGRVETTRTLIFFRGAMNPFVIFIAPLAMAHAAHSALKRRDALSFMALALFVAAYAPFWPAALIAKRISYIFYFLPALPAVALGAAGFLYARETPRLVRWAYIGAILLGFYGYFPFRQVP